MSKKNKSNNKRSSHDQSVPVQMTVGQKLWLKLGLILVLVVFFGGIIYPKIPAAIPGSDWFNKFTPKLGLDLQGGAHLVFEADISSLPAGEETSAVEGVKDVIERRVNTFGVAEPLIQTNKVGDKFRVIVELAGVFDVNEAIKQIGETPLLEFKTQNLSIGELPQITEEQQKEIEQYNTTAQTRAIEIIAKLNEGENFTDLAREFSNDPGSRDVGGDLGFVAKGQFVPEFEKAIFEDLANNEITTTPVESEFGWHIIEKLEEKGLGDDKEVHSRHILIAKKSAADYADLQDQWSNTALSGKDLERAQLVFNQNTGAPEVSLKFNDQGKDLFAAITKENLHKPVAIFLDGGPISVPTVQSEITTGEAIISGDFTISEAKLLAQRLNAGALPVPISLVQQQNVGATLGIESVEKSLIAGLIGILAVILFMIIYYRLMGLMAVIALGFYGVIVFGLFESIPVTLTLAGLAGFILSLGIAVDANILIFERVKEELKEDQPVDKAIEIGFRRAWSAIRDSNISSLITTVILFWFGSSVIKGFALTLGIGILVSMFSAITITKTLLLLVAKPKLAKIAWLFGYHK